MGVIASNQWWNHNYAILASVAGSVVTVIFGLIAQGENEIVTPALIVALSGLVTAVGGIIVGGGVPILKLLLQERRLDREFKERALKTKEHVESVEARVSDIERKSQTTVFNLIVEMAPVAIIAVRSAGIILIANKYAETMFGYEPSELYGQKLEILIPKRFRAAHGHFLKSFFAEPSVRQMGAGRELYGLRKNGSEFPVEIALKPIEFEDGTLVVAVIADITERTSQANLAAAIAQTTISTTHDPTNGDHGTP